jgi:hypothetical protein
MFAYTTLPLSVWFLGVYCITQSKVSVSALSLKRTIGVSYNTALLMKHKIQQVMKERDDSKPRTQFLQVDDAYGGGKKNDGIRGRGATGKIPYVAAVSCNEEGHPLQIRFSQIEAFTKDAIKALAEKHLAPGCNIVSDGLGCFRAFSEAEFNHFSIVTGGGPESVKIPEFKWVNTIIGNVKTALHGVFHALSEKHFSRYFGRILLPLQPSLRSETDGATIWVRCGQDSADATAASEAGRVSWVIKIFYDRVGE